jgi:hypothetical protein
MKLARLASVVAYRGQRRRERGGASHELYWHRRAREGKPDPIERRVRAEAARFAEVLGTQPQARRAALDAKLKAAGRETLAQVRKKRRSPPVHVARRQTVRSGTVNLERRDPAGVTTNLQRIPPCLTVRGDDVRTSVAASPSARSSDGLQAPQGSNRSRRTFTYVALCPEFTGTLLSIIRQSGFPRSGFES